MTPAAPVTTILAGFPGQDSSDRTLRYLAASSFPYPVIRISRSGDRTVAAAFGQQSLALLPDQDSPLALPLGKALDMVPTPLVFVAPSEFVPISQGLAGAFAILQRQPRAVAAGGVVLAHRSTQAAGEAEPAGDVDRQYWQIAFPPKIARRRPVARLGAITTNYRPFASFVCRTAALREAVGAVASLRLGDALLEEILIAIELGLRGQIVSFTDLAIAMGPAARLDAYRTPAEAYGRFLDAAWFERFSPIAREFAARLERRDWLAFMHRVRGLPRGLSSFVRQPAGGIALPGNWAEDRIRNAVGDALFSIMAGKVLAATPGEPGLRALTLELAKNTGHSTPAIERLEADIRDYWAMITAEVAADAAVPAGGLARA